MSRAVLAILVMMPSLPGLAWGQAILNVEALQREEVFEFHGEGGLGVQLTKGLNLDLALIWRHDSRAPADLESDDIELKIGFTYRVR